MSGCASSGTEVCFVPEVCFEKRKWETAASVYLHDLYILEETKYFFHFQGTCFSKKLNCTNRASLKRSYLRALVADDEVLDRAVLVAPLEQVEPHRHVGRVHKVGRPVRDDRLLTQRPDVTENVGGAAAAEAVEADGPDVVVLAALETIS
jgi:hypothetical protein